MLRLTELTRGSSAMTLADIERMLTDLERKHVPFATMMAINRTMFDVHGAVRGDMPDIFTLRRPWAQRGVRYAKATKRSLQAFIYTKDWFMRDQEVGANRRARRSRFLFRPTLAIRRGEVLEGLPTKRPKTIMRQIRDNAVKGKAAGARRRRGRKPTPFLATMKNGKRGLFIRDGRERKPITLLYVFEREVEIEPVWRFERTGLEISDKHLRRYFVEEMGKALANNKTRGEVDPIRSPVIDLLGEFPAALEDPVRFFGPGV